MSPNETDTTSGGSPKSVIDIIRDKFKFRKKGTLTTLSKGLDTRIFIVERGYEHDRIYTEDMRHT